MLSYIEIAKQAVLNSTNAVVEAGGLTKEETGELSDREITVHWFAKTLHNWKSFLSCERADNFFFEVTHNGEDDETYVDTYLLSDDFLILGDEFPFSEGELYEKLTLIISTVSEIDEKNLYVVWFNYSQSAMTHQALISTDVTPGLYWQVTYEQRGDKYRVEAFTKINNNVL